uniref:F-box domain-containing protein n=1 Tax=Rhizophora mucronata TaxID=61149 RepID=A0A2P2IN08_RHIMU
MSRTGQTWADLPKELLETIVGHLDSRVDALRFRSVCRSWRSVHYFRPETPCLHFKLPLIKPKAFLSQYAICRLELPYQDPASSSSSSQSKGWLTKVRKSRRGKLELMHPFSTQKIVGSPIVLNLLDISLVQLSTSFLLTTSNEPSLLEINKAVLFPASAKSYKKDEFAILAIFCDGKLRYWRYGNEHWTLLDDKKFQYDDIIIYKGQFYVVDQWGTVSWIDSSLRVIQYAPPLYGCGGKKNLVESCGDLYVVDRYLDGMRRALIWNESDNTDRMLARRYNLLGRITPKAVDFRVYKLDEERATWVNVKSLGDRAFFLGVDCSFSVSSKEFAAGKGNCIYFTDYEFYASKRLSEAVLVFKLEDGSIEQLSFLPEYREIFWPPNCPRHSNMSSVGWSRQFGHFGVPI